MHPLGFSLTTPPFPWSAIHRRYNPLPAETTLTLSSHPLPFLWIYIKTFLFEVLLHVRGVLGNKCAEWHNLKTVHFKEIIVSGIFCHGYQQYMCFFAAFYLLQDGGSELLCSDGGGDPPTCSSWRCPGATSSLKALISLLGRNKRPLVWKTAIMALGEHLNAFFHSQLLKIAVAMAVWPATLQKTSSLQTCLVF